MVRFEPKTKAEMDLVSKYHRQIQGLIIILANRELNIKSSHLTGIFKCEGGVNVNGVEICIRSDYVQDDFSYARDPIPEEEAVVKAISKIMSSTDFTSEETAKETLQGFVNHELTNEELNLLLEFTQRGQLGGNNLIAFFQEM